LPLSAILQLVDCRDELAPVFDFSLLVHADDDVEFVLDRGYEIHHRQAVKFEIAGKSGRVLDGDARLVVWGGEGADVFVLRTDTATPATPDCGCGNVDGLDEITSDFILDYNSAQGDKIGLTGGLTVNDIVLTEKTITYGDRRDFDSSGPFPLGQIRTLDFQIESASVTVITQAKTGNVLGLVKGVSPAQLQFVSFSDSM
jgi:hypothetical protein